MKHPKSPAPDREKLEKLYKKLNRRVLVHPDPLEFLYRYDNVKDREIAGLVAASLAYGNVKQIIRSVASVLDIVGPNPADYLSRTRESTLYKRLEGFKHRWSTGDEVASLLVGAKRVVKKYGGLENCFVAGIDDGCDTVLPALSAFATELTTAAGGCCASLVPAPEKGSACKRLNLFIKWMVRADDVDPGGWGRVAPAKLIIPLDTHMYRICCALGMTARKQADMKTALEITAAFGTLSPGDPTKYDFALTRLGIRDDLEIGPFLKECGVE